MVFMKIICVVTLLWCLFGCQTPSRYSQTVDSAPDFVYPEPQMEDQTPRHEPYRERNSLPYRINGKSYTPLTTGKGYVATGTASWYGQKFHGHLTSNGEVYNMFDMTAAHRTLPLPSYVRVTNIDNDISTIVRVNDRGPFHSERVIDLSYAAAKKLRFDDAGTARVRLEVIHINEDNMVTIGNAPPVPFALYNGELPPQSSAETDQANVTSGVTQEPSIQPTAGYYIQVAALADESKAKALSTGLSSLYQVPTEIPLIDDIYRLRLGPLKNRFVLDLLLDEVKKNGYPGAYKIIVN